MNIGKLATILAMTAAIGAATPAFAATPSGGAQDETGLSTLGVDITRAGGSPQSVEKFLAALSPDARRGVISGCQTASRGSADFAPSVLSFCAAVDRIGPTTSSALGYAPMRKAGPIESFLGSSSSVSSQEQSAPGATRSGGYVPVGPEVAPY